MAPVATSDVSLHPCNRIEPGCVTRHLGTICGGDRLGAHADRGVCLVQLSLTGPRAAIEFVDGSSLTWEDLYSDLSPALESYARSRGVRDPEDLVQDVFASFYRRSDEFVGDMSGLRSLLFTIAYRRIVDAHRHSARRPEVLVAVPSETGPGSNAGPGVEEAIVSTDTVSAALGALSALTDRERSVITMRIFEEVPPAEVSRRLGLTSANVRVIQARAFRKVRAALEAEGHFRLPLALIASVSSLRHLISRLPNRGVLGDWVRQMRSGKSAPTARSTAWWHLSPPEGSVAGQVVETGSYLGMRAAAALSALAVGAAVVVPAATPTEPDSAGGEPPSPAAAAPAIPAESGGAQSGDDPTSPTTPEAAIEPDAVSRVPAPTRSTTPEAEAIAALTAEDLELLLAEIDGSLAWTVSAVVEEVGDSLVGLAEATLSEVTGAASGVVEAATDATGAVIDDVVETADSVSGELAATTEDVLETTDDVVDSVVVDPVDEVVEGTDELVDPIEEATGEVEEVVDEVVEGTEELVDDLVDDLGLFG